MHCLLEGMACGCGGDHASAPAVRAADGVDRLARATELARIWGPDHPSGWRSQFGRKGLSFHTVLQNRATMSHDSVAGPHARVWHSARRIQALCVRRMPTTAWLSQLDAVGTRAEGGVFLCCFLRCVFPAAGACVRMPPFGRFEGFGLDVRRDRRKKRFFLKDGRIEEPRKRNKNQRKKKKGREEAPAHNFASHPTHRLYMP